MPDEPPPPCEEALGSASGLEANVEHPKPQPVAPMTPLQSVTLIRAAGSAKRDVGYQPRFRNGLWLP